MAEPRYIDIYDDVTGAIGTKKDCICRRKYYKYGGMRVAGRKEVYKVCNPRDFEKKPQQGREKESSTAFSEARKKRILIETTMPELYAKWKEAFKKQLKKPDWDSPLVPPDNHDHRTYVRLANYIETKIRLRGDIEKTECESPY